MNRRATTSQSRRPAQERGERRVDAILTAAADLLSDVGYDGLTLTAVAERSGSATGSLYHFFANKEQLINGLIERIIADVRASLPSILAPDLAALPLETFVATLFGRVTAVAARHPEVIELLGLRAGTASAALAISQRLDDEIAARFDAVIGARAHDLSKTERTRVIRMSIAILRSGLILWLSAPRNARQGHRLEAELALTSYLMARLRDAR